MKILGTLVGIGLVAFLALTFLRGTGGGLSFQPDIADPVAFVAAARALIDPAVAEHVDVAEDKLPPALKAVSHKKVQVAKDHVDFVTFSEPDGQLGYRVWLDKPAAGAPPSPTKWPDIHSLDVDFGKPFGTAENWP